LAQVRDFALVIVLVGVSPAYKHIGTDVVSVVVLALVVTSTISTYLIQFSHQIASAFVKGATRTVLEDSQARDTRRIKRPPAPLMLVGCFRAASSLVHELVKEKKEFAVIDFNPAVHSQLERRGVKCTYGDIGSLDTLHHAGVEHAKILVASIPDEFLRGTDNRRLLATFKKINPTAKIVVAADRIARAQELYAAGADFVLVPRFLACDRLKAVQYNSMTITWLALPSASHVVRRFSGRDNNLSTNSPLTSWNAWLSVDSVIRSQSQLCRRCGLPKTRRKFSVSPIVRRRGPLRTATPGISLARNPFG
jgi:Trk K+ transport system NAD-binding subunit